MQEIILKVLANCSETQKLKSVISKEYIMMVVMLVQSCTIAQYALKTLDILKKIIVLRLFSNCPIG